MKRIEAQSVRTTSQDPFKAVTDWEKKFLANLNSGTLKCAARAWHRLTDAGLSDITKVILFQAQAYGSAVPAEVSKGLSHQVHELRALKRAKTVVDGRKGDRRKELFAERLREHQMGSGQTVWPFRDNRVKTLADASVRYPVIGNLTVDAAPAVIGASRQALVRYAEKPLLATLRAGAKGHGVKLSLMELAELWYASDGNRPPDVINRRNILRRFLKLPANKLAEQGYLLWFEEWLRQMRKAAKPA